MTPVEIGTVLADRYRLVRRLAEGHHGIVC